MRRAGRYTAHMARIPDVQVRLRIDFTSGASFGPGKVALLERIASSGSLSQAARELGLSYRRGWVLLNDLNQAFGEPVVVTATGGAHGGGAKLTALGEDLIARYRSVEQAAEKAAVSAFRRLASDAGGKRAAASPLRRPMSRKVATR